MTPCNNNQVPTPTRSNNADLGTNTTTLTDLLNAIIVTKQHTGDTEEPASRPQQQQEYQHYHQHQHTHDRSPPPKSQFEPSRASLQAMEAIDEVLAMLEEDRHLDLFRDADQQ